MIKEYKKIILNCSECGSEIERDRITNNAVCFTCKRIRARNRTRILKKKLSPVKL
jgi:DNA-directed RNA polymerase subunit RPC12/RpoP